MKAVHLLNLSRKDVMDFRQWFSEWEGNSFLQVQDLVNGPEFPGSKYVARDKPKEKDIKTRKSPDKIFGFKEKDRVLMTKGIKKL